MQRLVFQGRVVRCSACGSEVFEEVVDDHVQLFRCRACGGFVAFGNAAVVKRIPHDRPDRRKR